MEKEMTSIQDNEKNPLQEMFRKLDSEYQNLIISISWLAPGEKLPLDLLQRIAGIGEVDELVQKLGFLVNMGFLTRENEEFFLESKVGKLIFETIEKKVADDILRKTSKEMHQLTNDIEQPELFQPYEKHIEKLAQQGQIHKIATAGLLFGLLGRYKLQIGNNEDAVKFIRRALLIIEKVSGVESVEHTENLNNLGSALHRTRRYEDAKKCFEQAIIIDKKILGEDDPAVAIGHNNLGQVLIDMNSLEGAIIHLEKALEINVENFGNEHPIVASGHYNLGMALIAIGDMPRARAQLELALAKRVENFGENHPVVAEAHHGLGMLLQTIGNVPGAVEHYQKAVNIYESENIENNMKLAASYTNLGGLHHFSGEFDNAINYYKKAVEIFETEMTVEEKYLKDLHLQLKLAEMGMTMPQLLEKMESGEKLSEELMNILNENFGDGEVL
jgi:tetratricopeptide (TPR) repeat protein